MKVLHLPTSVGGNSWGLSQAEQSRGIDSKVLVSRQNWLKYDANINLHLEKKNIVRQLFTLYKAFVSIKNKYDVLHFNYGSSLWDFQKVGLILLDLPFYGKKQKIIFTYNGSDARAVHPLDYWKALPKYKYTLYEKIALLIKKIKIKKVNKYADHIFSLNPDLLDYLPKNATFLPYTIAQWEKISKRPYEIKEKIKIIHSPTSREFKGSKYILDSLEKLQEKYSNIEVKIIENITHEEALNLYQEAHLVIDQVLIGWYGGFAVEVMKMGKPLAVYIREEDLKFIPQNMADELKESIIQITPFNIEEVLGRYIENKDLLYEKSEKSFQYVNRWHDPKYISSIVEKIYEL